MTFLPPKALIILIFIVSNCQFAMAQSDFLANQKSFKRVELAFKQKEDSLKIAFAKTTNLTWPPQQIYLRSFKYDSQIEVWVRNTTIDTFALFKTYKVCALSGSLGPKRVEGDYQVPEGLYSINKFNPQSMYHLSLGVNYPNESDAFFSDSTAPGGEIFIHGSCVTVGCIPIKDAAIEELYILAAHAKQAGQDFIPLHIFPVQYKNIKSLKYLALQCLDKPNYQNFVESLQIIYDYFNTHKKLPILGINGKGNYIVLK
jgi:murein L,D-transpeptidase YafK